jgi:hypothetical protein
MAEAFNLNQFLNEYKTYNNRQYTAIENGQRAMEEREAQRVQEAVGNTGFLGITLSKKMSEMGVGPRVVEQLGDTAKNMITGVVSPFTEWLEKYETVFDERAYNGEMQAMGKQMFQAKVALDIETKKAVVGQKFVAEY